MKLYIEPVVIARSRPYRDSGNLLDNDTRPNNSNIKYSRTCSAICQIKLQLPRRQMPQMR